jgi:DNA-binding XRE family transcriptional regulator
MWRDAMTETNSATAIDATALWRYLDERGIQRVWLAGQLGVSKQLISNIENGARSMPAWMPEDIAVILAVPVWMLFPGYDPVDSPGADDR